MLRIVIFWIGAITTACLAAVALLSTIGWGKAFYDHKKGKRVDQPKRKVTASRDEVAA